MNWDIYNFLHVADMEYLLSFEDGGRQRNPVKINEGSLFWLIIVPPLATQLSIVLINKEYLRAYYVQKLYLLHTSCFMKNDQRDIFIKLFVQSIIATLSELLIERVAWGYCGPELPVLIYYILLVNCLTSQHIYLVRDMELGAGFCLFIPYFRMHVDDHFIWSLISSIALFMHLSGMLMKPLPKLVKIFRETDWGLLSKFPRGSLCPHFLCHCTYSREAVGSSFSFLCWVHLHFVSVVCHFLIKFYFLLQICHFFYNLRSTCES